MRMRALMMLGVAIVLGLASVFLIQRLVESRVLAAESRSGGPTKVLVVAQETLSYGAKLTRDNLVELNWPADSVPSGSFDSLDDLLSSDKAPVVLQQIDKGMPILQSMISGFSGRATLSNVIEKGMRAITIRVNDVLGVAGFVLPGDRVDVMLTEKGNNSNPTTEILLQNVRVLGIDQDANVQKDQPSVARAITLEVSPLQAQKLTLGASVGELGLALRNVANVTEVPTQSIGLRDLRISDSAAQKTAPKAQVVDTAALVRVFRGTNESSVEVSRYDMQAASASLR